MHCLNEKQPHRGVYLNTWSQVGGAVCGGLKLLPCLRKCITVCEL